MWISAREQPSPLVSAYLDVGVDVGSEEGVNCERLDSGPGAGVEMPESPILELTSTGSPTGVEVSESLILELTSTGSLTCVEVPCGGVDLDDEPSRVDNGSTEGTI